MANHKKPSTPRETLPADGMSRWKQIEPFSPFSREKYRQLVKAGKAPQPIKFSERCTAYPNKELHRFFDDPLNYSVEVKPDEVTESGGVDCVGVPLAKGSRDE